MTRLCLATVLTCLFLAGVFTSAKAVVRSSTGSGGWGSATTWNPEGVPTADDTVIIQRAHSVTVGTSSPPVARRLVVQEYGTLSSGVPVSITVGGQLHNAGTLALSNTAAGNQALSVGDSLMLDYGAVITLKAYYVAVNGPVVNHGTISRISAGSFSFGSFINTGTYENSSPFSSSSLTVNGDFTNESGANFIHGGNIGAITFNGNVTNNGATFSVSYSNSLTFGGNFTNNSPASFGSVPVTFSGSAANSIGGTAPPTFRKLTVNKTGGSLSLACDLTVQHGGLTVRAGELALEGHVLTLGSATAAGSVRVEADGTFTAAGKPRDANAVVVACGALYPYAFVVDAGGTIAAFYADFRHMDTCGVTVLAGARVDSTKNFSFCSFDHGSDSGPMLKIENSQVIDDMVNVNFDGSAGYNVEKLASAGRVRVIGGTGTRWGEDYENDPDNRIDWVPVAIGEPTGLPAGSRPRMATVIRGTLHLAGDSRQHTACRAGLLDITGRETVSLVPGANDVTRLAPGVYFVRPATGNRPERVVIAR